METKFQGVIVSHDMTKKQREECKVLLQRLKVRVSRGTGFTMSGHTRALERKLIQIRKKLVASVEVLYRNDKNKSNKKNLQNTLSIHIKNFGSVHKR